MGIEIWRSGARVLPYCSVAIPLQSQASLHRMIIKRHSPRDWSCIKPLWTQRRCPTCATSWVLLGRRGITFKFRDWRKTRILLISIFHRLTDSIAEINRADGQCILWRQTPLKNVIKTKDFMIFCFWNIAQLMPMRISAIVALRCCSESQVEIILNRCRGETI